MKRIEKESISRENRPNISSGAKNNFRIFSPQKDNQTKYGKKHFLIPQNRIYIQVYLADSIDGR